MVNYLIAGMLEALVCNGGDSACDDLIVLIKHQLGAVESDYEKKERRRAQRSRAVWIAATMAAGGEAPTFRKIGRAIGVDASTVMRWFPDRDMSAQFRKLHSDIKNLHAVSKHGSDSR